VHCEDHAGKLDDQKNAKINKTNEKLSNHTILKMRKTIAIIGAIIILGGLGTFIYLQKQQVPEYNISRLVSSEAAFFIDVHDPLDFLDKIREDNKIWDELSKIKAVQAFDGNLHTLDSLIKEDDALRSAIEDKRIIISAEKQGKKRIGFTFLMKAGNIREQKKLQGYLEKWGTPGQTQLRTRNYNRIKLYSIRKKERTVLSFATIQGVLIASRSEMLVEQAIRQSSVDNPVTNDSSFKKIRETAGKNVAGNLYINFDHLPELLALPLDQPFRDYIEQLSHFASWSVLDMNIKPDAFLLNGFSMDDPERSDVLDLFTHQEPVDLDIENVLPANTSTFISLGISNKEQYKSQLHELYQQKGSLNDYRQWKDQIHSDYGFDPEETFYNLLHEEAGIAFLSANAKQPRKSAFIVLKTKGKRQARSSLSQVSRKAVERAGEPPHQTSLKIDQETHYPIYKLPVEELFARLFGSLFRGFGNKYFTLLDNYVVFGSSPEMLKEFIYSNILNKTLNHNPNYEKFSEYLSDQSNFHFYTNMYRSPHLIAHYLRDDLKKSIDENLEHFRKFQALAYQFMGNEGMCYNNLFIKYIPRIREEPKTVWETHLDTAVDFKPALVTNHYTGKNEIFVQDLNNKIYLINNVGRILWEKQLNEPIMSDVYQIDYYRNGKLQMMFNTRNKIHLLDRNGNYVERYPVSLPSPATAPMALFDYENNRKYRIFIPCENKKIYDFSKDGDIIPGWEFDQTDTRVTKRVQHFRVDTKDYIVFADQYRIYILNRRGQVRVRLEDQFARSKNNLFVLEPGTSQNPPRLATTDRNGTVRYVRFNGEVSSLDMGQHSTNHHFDYQDIDSDGLKDFIFLDDNTLEVKDRKGKEIYSVELEAEISDPPIHFYFSYEDRKIGLVSDQQNQIYLFNPDGDVYEGFPLKGSTPFSIGYLDDAGKDFHLIVGNKYNFLYNYNVIGK